MARRAPTFDELKDEYTHLLANAAIVPAWEAEAKRVAKCIVDARPTLDQVEQHTGVPWWLVGVIQSMEAGCHGGKLDLTKHLHNGDSLKAKTHNVPAGRPHGIPPFTFLQSAIDAIQYDGLDKVDWSEGGVEKACFFLEGYNGWGVRMYHSDVLTAYLWSGTNQYKRGKYVADGQWSSVAVSGQIGAVPIILALKEMGAIPEPKLILDPVDGPKGAVAGSVAVTRWPSAEQERQDTSAKEVVAEGSRSMNMFEWLKWKFGIGVAVDAVYQYAKNFTDGKDWLNDVATFIESHAGLLIGAFLVSCFVMAVLGGWYLLEAHRDGRYDPRKA